MEVSRSGYYKWLKRPTNDRKVKREVLIKIVEEVHIKHPSHGYRWIAAYIRINYEYEFSDNFIFKIFHYLDIKAESKHLRKSKPRKIRDKYPNLIYSTWDSVDRPRQVIVSDMTAFHIYYFYIEVTFYFDVFTKQIVAVGIAERKGDRYQYINGLKDVLKLLEEEGCTDPVVLHTDQGSVYASIAYNDLIKDKNIIRSMSRAGKPTDNPVNESLNGWIKEELYMDFRLNEVRNKEDAIKIILGYIDFYNAKRPCYALNYDTPDHYYQRYMNGEIEYKNTFNSRVLDETPKFIRERRNNKRYIIINKLVPMITKISSNKSNIFDHIDTSKESVMSTFEKEKAEKSDDVSTFEKDIK